MMKRSIISRNWKRTRALPGIILVLFEPEVHLMNILSISCLSSTESTKFKSAMN